MDIETDRSSMVSIDLDAQPAEGAQQASCVNEQPGYFSGIGANFKACFAAAGDSLKNLYYSAKQKISDSIPKSLSGLSLSSAFSSASKSLSSLVKGFSFKTPSFMSSRGAGKASSNNVAEAESKAYEYEQLPRDDDAEADKRYKMTFRDSFGNEEAIDILSDFIEAPKDGAAKKV